MNAPAAESVPCSREDSYIGSVTDMPGEELSVFRTPAGNAAILGTEGTALMFRPGAVAELTEHLGRAVMPGQED